MRAIFHYACSPVLAGRITSAAPEWLDLRVCPDGPSHDAELRGLLSETDVLLHVLHPVTAELLADAPRLGLVQKIGVGVNTIDLDEARRREIPVCNMPGTNSQAVAEATLMLMLMALRRARALDETVRRADGWQLETGLFDRVGELKGRVVGLVGYGAIPTLLTPVLRALGAEVRYTARGPKTGVDAEWRTLPALLAESDVLSLHVPLTDETQGLIDEAALRAMKPGAVLVNTARGGLVDHDALARALESGHLSAAGLDVFDEEPLPAGHAVLGLGNAVLMPHVAWLTPETLDRSLAVAIENCRRLRGGEPLLHRVV